MKTFDFQNNLNYRFNNMEYLEKALTHGSFIQNKETFGERDNERLEFLGDAFLDAIISEELFRRLPDISEGKLTKLRASIVCEHSLALAGNRLGIGKHLKLGKGEENTGGRKRESIIADAVEATIAAIFLDGGFDEAKKFVLNTFAEIIEDAINGNFIKDYKSELQEVLQVNGDIRISYVIDREEGPDHDKTFFVSLFVEDKKIGDGRGKSKKEAEQNAAKTALENGRKK